MSNQKEIENNAIVQKIPILQRWRCYKDRWIVQASTNPKAIYGSPSSPPTTYRSNPLPLPIHHGELLGTSPAGGLGEHRQNKNYCNFHINNALAISGFHNFRNR